MGPYANLLLDCTDGLAVLTVNRPDKLNALNGQTLDALADFFADAGTSGDVSAVIVTGAGERSFVAGADIEEVSGFTPLEGRQWGLRGQALLQ
ncbi:MAG: hypothetical protein F4173_10225, partial [Acidobacteriia bacterium]|nr:hypothetical protein [Terriglobia bacterium]